jgi:hypothetical protein
MEQIGELIKEESQEAVCIPAKRQAVAGHAPQNKKRGPVAGNREGR